MRTRSLLMLGISVILGLLVVQWVRNSRNEPVPVADTLPSVIVAAHALNFGDHISVGALRLMKWSEAKPPQGSFSKLEDLTGPGEDRVVLRAMDAGELVLAGKVSGPGGRATLSTIIDKDMRAVTIRVTDQTGVAGFVLPNDRVDVLLTHAGAQEHDPQQTDVLLQNIKVLAIDQEASDQKDKPTVVKAVTLEVSPEDAQKLTLGAGIGTLSLTLRNFTDPQAVATRSLQVHDLTPSQPTPAVAQAPRPAPVKPRPQIEVFRGTAPTAYEVNRDGTIGAGTARAAPPPPPNEANGQPPQRTKTGAVVTD